MQDKLLLKRMIEENMVKQWYIVALILLLTSITACGGASRKVRLVPAAGSMAKKTLNTNSMGTDGTAIAKDDYRIGVGDVLFISVWKDESLTQQVTVLPDGTITYPLIGEVIVKNLTLAELKILLKKKLSRFVPDATLSAQVLQLNSQVFYIIGKVNGPGRFLISDRISVLQGLAIAGGLNPFAKSKRVKIFRKTPKGTRIFPFNYDEVVKGKHLEQNITIERADVIVVP